MILTSLIYSWLMLISDICLEMKGRVKKKCVMVTAAVLSGSRLMKFKWGSSDSVQSPPNSVRQPTQQKWAKTMKWVFRQLIFSCSYFWLNSNLQRKNRPPKLFLLFIFSHAWLVYFVRHIYRHTYLQLRPLQSASCAFSCTEKTGGLQRERYFSATNENTASSE